MAGITEAEPTVHDIKNSASSAVQSTAPAQKSSPRSGARNSLRGVGYEKGKQQLKPGDGDATLAKKKELGIITVVGTGTRKTYVPKKPNGKTLYFFFGLKGDAKDKGYRDTMDNDVEDDVASAVLQGFQVTYDRAGTKADFTGALYDSNCFGVYWCGHGYMDGSIQTSDGGRVKPEDVDKTRVSGNIQYLILAACGSGKGMAKWKAAMGPQCLFQGWVNTVSLAKVNDFTSEAAIGDSWSGHEGTNEDMELDDYIARARAAKKK